MSEHWTTCHETVTTAYNVNFILRGLIFLLLWHLFSILCFQTKCYICLYLFLIQLLETCRKVLKCVTKLFLLTNSNMNSAYGRLLLSIQRVIYQEGFDGSDPQVLKIIILFCNPVTNVVFWIFKGSTRRSWTK